ncbi:hypothetical protein C4588_05815 [Candidatus Parcubacteria bacterium]|nr:MAG: hypothetical protein C4588_05815 [Candidatus Parcubacteria bacterium]
MSKQFKNPLQVKKRIDLINALSKNGVIAAQEKDAYIKACIGAHISQSLNKKMKRNSLNLYKQLSSLENKALNKILINK